LPAGPRSCAARSRGERGGARTIGLLIGLGDVEVPVFDPTRPHAEAAVDTALA
jgi:hypothetical protein